MGVDERFQPQLIVGISSDVAEIIGEDAENIIQQQSISTNTKAIWISCGGLKGNWVNGYGLVMQNLSTIMKICSIKARTINILGCSSQSVTESSDISEMKRLLRRIGVNVHSCLLHNTMIDDIITAPCVELNVIIDEGFGMLLAKEMKSKFDTPWLLLPPPMGFTMTAEWLCAINDAMDNPITDIDRILDDEFERWSRRARALTSATTVPVRAAVCAEPTLANGLARLLQELGEVVTVVATRTPPGEQAGLWFSNLAAKDIQVLIEPEPADFAAAVRDTGTTMIFGSTMERFVSTDTGAQLVECVFPAVRTVGWVEPLAGYAGVVTMARLLARSFLGQVF